MSVCSPRDLTQWLEAGHHALDSGHRLRVDHLRALAATPDTPGRDGTHRRTWYLEEAERLQREQMRHRWPADGSARERWWWQLMQDDRSDQIQSLLDQHADAMLAASARAGARPARPRATPTRSPKRRTAADDALTLTEQDAVGATTPTQQDATAA